MDEILQAVAEMLPEGWSIYDEHMGWEFLLECPCGNVVEQDGRCPNGCVSPLRELGLA